MFPVDSLQELQFMTWRGATTPPDRIFSALAYLLPLAGVVFPLFGTIPFGYYLLRDFPFLSLLQILVAPVLLIYTLVPFGELVVFMVLLVLVVRNERIHHFIRFNVMQAIILDIGLFVLYILFSLILTLGLPVLQETGNEAGLFFLETLSNVIFFGAVVSVGYGIVQSCLGLYPDKIPAVSEATYVQVR